MDQLLPCGMAGCSNQALPAPCYKTDSLCTDTTRGQDRPSAVQCRPAQACRSLLVRLGSPSPTRVQPRHERGPMQPTLFVCCGVPRPPRHVRVSHCESAERRQWLYYRVLCRDGHHSCCLASPETKQRLQRLQQRQQEAQKHQNLGPRNCQCLKNTAEQKSIGKKSGEKKRGARRARVRRGETHGKRERRVVPRETKEQKETPKERGMRIQSKGERALPRRRKKLATRGAKRVEAREAERQPS